MMCSLETKCCKNEPDNVGTGRGSVEVAPLNSVRTCCSEEQVGGDEEHEVLMGEGGVWVYYVRVIRAR